MYFYTQMEKWAVFIIRVLDPSHFDENPDPGKEIEVDPEQGSKWIRIWIRPNVVDPDPDPDPKPKYVTYIIDYNL